MAVALLAEYNLDERPEIPLVKRLVLLYISGPEVLTNLLAVSLYTKASGSSYETFCNFNKAALHFTFMCLQGSRAAWKRNMANTGVQAMQPVLTRLTSSRHCRTFPAIGSREMGFQILDLELLSRSKNTIPNK